MARHNPYNIEQVMEKHNLSEEEAQKKIDVLKSRTSGSKSTYINRYGKELGLKKYKEFCEKSARTKEKYIQKYGESEGEHLWSEYLKTKDSTSLDFHIKKYGEDLGKIKYEERLKSISTSLENMQDKYGKEEGQIRYDAMNKSRSRSCSTEGLIEKFGIEKALLINKSKGQPGKLNPMYGKPSPMGSGNGWSGWYNGQYFRSILELSYMKYLDNIGVEYKSAECKEYEVKYTKDGTSRTYRPDFIVGDLIIEIKPKKLVNTIENTLKFNAAKKRFGKKFKIITEYDFSVIDDISSLIDSGEVQLSDRYLKKYNERKNNENN